MNLDETSGKKYSAWSLTLIAVVFVWVAPLFWKEVEISRSGVSESFENSELCQFVYPALEYVYGRLRAADLPLWNPNQLCGTPTFDDPRISIFQPLNVVFLFLPTPKAMAVHSFVCLAVAGLGFTLFLRSLGLSYIAAFLGSVVYAFSGASAAAMSRPGPAAALAWLPFCLWAAREFLSSPNRTWAVLLGIALGLCMLSGTFALNILVLLLVLAFLVVERSLAYVSKTAPPSYAGGFLLAAGIAAGFSAVLWIPVISSVKDWAYPDQYFWGMAVDAQVPVSPRTLLAQLFMSRPGALPRLGYVGIGTLLVIPGAFFHWQRRKETSFFAGALLLLVVLYLFRWNRMPWGFPSHTCLYMVVVCLAVLAAIATDRVLIRPRPYRIPAVWPPGLLITVCAGVLFYAAAGQIRGYVLAFVCILFPALLFRVLPVRIISGWLLACLIFIDLTVASVNAYRHPFVSGKELSPHASEVIQTAQTLAGEGRIVLSARDLDSVFPENIGMLLPVASVGGVYLPLRKEEAMWWQKLSQSDLPLLQTSGKGIRPDSSHIRLLHYMAAKAIVATPEGNFYENKPQESEMSHFVLDKVMGNTRIWVNSDALPRVLWVPSWRVEKDTGAAIDALASADFNPHQTCILEQDPIFPEKAGGPAAKSQELEKSATEESGTVPAWRCSIQIIQPERVTVQASAPENGIVILADRYIPGWLAYLDGTPAPILRANVLFRGVAVPAGSHVVEFIYRPASFVVGAGLSLATLLLALALLVPQAVFKTQKTSA